ncbi:hypothetical protein QQM79_10735 [Marinobacteraceae bacterium S3BR75-40.1]
MTTDKPITDAVPETRQQQTPPSQDSPSAAGQQPRLEPYWIERKRYLEKVRGIPELRKRYAKALFIYLLRRFLWSFAFFPLFIAFWVPFVLSRFNPVAMVSDLLPTLTRFVEASPQSQAAMVDTLVIAWLSIGCIFAIFDFVLTPFKSPYEYEADVHMRAWEQMHSQGEEQ